MKDREPKRNRGIKACKRRGRSTSVHYDVAQFGDYTSQWLLSLTIVAAGSLLTMSPSEVYGPSLPSIIKSAPKWFDVVDLEWLLSDMSFTNSNDTFKDPYGTHRKTLGIRHLNDPAIISNSQPAMLYPLLTENLPNVLNRTPGSEMFPSTSRSNDPSLLDIEAIDVFWRRDIDIEKGAAWVDQPITYDQSERDIQVLSEKMFRPVS
uniref:Uncharacterized protein n=1 Tax=Steinernema glaseri TaxID=37863 RepID=A0A1I8APQ8_9BILA